MKKLLVVPIAALVLAACSEGPTAPAPDMTPNFLASHGSINDPTDISAVVTAGAVDSDVTISWKWIDEEDGWDLVSFTLVRDGDDVAGEPANAKPYAANAELSRSHTDYGVPDGTYQYCVEVMAKYFSEAQEATLTHHNVSCAEVTVGGGDFAFVRIAANNDNTETPDSETLALKKSGSLVVFAVLYYDDALANDCTTVPASSASATITFSAPGAGSSTHVADECAYNGASDRYRYKFTLTNHFNNQAGAGTIEFKVDGSTVTTYAFTTS